MSITQTESDAPAWLLLATSLPGRDVGAARVRLWRSLRDVGAANLRDGVSVMPRSAAAQRSLAAIIEQIESAGGSGWLFTVPTQTAVLERRLKSLFDRGADYQELASSMSVLLGKVAKLDEASVRQQLRQIERGLHAVAEHDFFPGREQARARSSLARLRAKVDRRFSPAEPSERPGEVALRDRAAFQRRRWATRKRLWIDRVASAWLIRRFIDTQAAFHWLDQPSDCPADAHGFDFDGATFTHIGDLVTFEVLLKAFNLVGDGGLEGLARLVHYLDVGGDSVAEAAGFEALLSGLRDGCADDDALLAAATPALDALYRYYLKTSR